VVHRSGESCSQSGVDARTGFAGICLGRQYYAFIFLTDCFDRTVINTRATSFNRVFAMEMIAAERMT
jgi:hypothetical protein